MSLRDLRDAYNRFFFDPISPTTIGLYRILFGALVMLEFALIGEDLLVWYGTKGLITPAIGRLLDGGSGLNLFNYLPQSDTWVIILYWCGVLAGFMAMIGLGTRVSLVACYLLVVTFHHRNTFMIHAGDTFLRVASFIMMFTQAGAAYSLDRLIRVARGKESGAPKPVEPWAQRLLQVLVASVYFYTFCWKIMGAKWLDGTAIYYTSRLQEFWRFPTPYVYEHMWTIKLMTWGTLVTEFSLGVLVWFKELRYWVLLGGVLLHAGIDYSMNIPMFAPVMVAAYLTFVDPSDLSRFFALVRSKWNARAGLSLPIPLFYDGKCSFCIRSVELVNRLDVLRRLDYLDMHSGEVRKLYPDLDPQRATKEMLVRAPGGKWLGGFYAFRYLAKHLPLCWPIRPLLHFPPVAALGEKIYSRVAANRYCIIPNQPKARRKAEAASTR